MEIKSQISKTKRKNTLKLTKLNSAYELICTVLF